MGSIQPDPSDMKSQNGQRWPLQIKPTRTTTVLTAVVKGGGPSGLAAAITLAQEGFLVKVTEKRPYRPAGHGRRNMVALRPEALRILDQLQALEILLKSKTGYGLTRMVEGKTTNHWAAHDDPFRVFEWPLKRYPPAEPDAETAQSEEYEIPEKVSDQVPSCFVNLGDLEDCLTEAAINTGAVITYDASIHLSRDKQGDTKRYRATLVRTEGNEDLGFPDLIVCASGKGDLALERELDFRRRIGVKLEDENLPSTVESRELKLDSEGELESQWFSVYGVVTPAAKMGVIDHNILKKDTGQPEQPVVEIQMNHARASHCLMQLPRGLDPEKKPLLEAYIAKRTNDKLGTEFTSVQDMKTQNVLVWGNPLEPVIVETSTAPTYVFGSNVVLVGDAAVSCSPSSGLGAEVGLTLDSQNIRQLAQTLKRAAESKQSKKRTERSQRQGALDSFNLTKAQSAVLWSQGSRMFYLSSQAANNILDEQERLRSEV